jgi:hypothetical protein
MKNDIMIPKPRSEYTDDDKKLFSMDDKKLFSMDAKTMNTLYCALSRSEFNRISCKNVKGYGYQFLMFEFKFICLNSFFIYMLRPLIGQDYDYKLFLVCY